jgi:hypothetical protein
MNKAKLEKLKAELRRRIEAKRLRDEAAKPCPECGGTSVLAGGFAQVRITGPDESLCETCEVVAHDNGLELIEMWPPRGVEGSPRVSSDGDTYN